MHTLTSSIFLPAYLSQLPLSLRRALLRRYIIEVFHFALARGRPPIDPELIMSYDLYPTINTEGSEEALKQLVKNGKALGKGTKEERNVWLSLLESAMIYPGMSLLLFCPLSSLFPGLPPSRTSPSFVIHSTRSGRVESNFSRLFHLITSDLQCCDANVTVYQIPM